MIYLDEGSNTPAPWVNVVSNPKGFGFVITEAGGGYSWAGNSRENRITPWSNDPVLDPPGEIIYIQDSESLEYWSPSPGPVRTNNSYIIRHGQGYSIFENLTSDIFQEMTVFVPIEENIKYYKLKLRNNGNSTRKLSLSAYFEWVLGFHRSRTSHQIVTYRDKDVFIAKNPMSLEFSDKLTFVTTNRKVSSFTCDRRSFLGRFRDYEYPIGLELSELDGSIGAANDSCLALRVDIELKAQGEEDVLFVLGQVENSLYDRKKALSFANPYKADRYLNNVKKYWDKTLNTLRVKTPFREFDILINRWTLYQVISCRFWARTGFYQSGGAFGFRDQLQDVTSLLHTRPEIARAHILRAASYQFKEGDVLHWWHPPSGKGVRTKFSDDLLWLCFATTTYISMTGEEKILDEKIPFVEGPELSEGQVDLYLQTERGGKPASLYHHCTLALDRSLKTGIHGLPLMGSGDWNDGMSNVGSKGEGESIWMAWFLGANLKSFIPICEKRGDHERVSRYQTFLDDLLVSVEKTGWDGHWYRRAYFDDGAPLGSKENEECEIDSIAQSWSVLSNLGDEKLVKVALNSAKAFLIDEESKLSPLLFPAFDKTLLDPGYIKCYPPGIRENGGQYNHAAIWLAKAYFEILDPETAYRLMGFVHPILRSLNKDSSNKYILEPYVLAADVYTSPMHYGRGGWSWYTGAAAWFYRVFVESLLGITKEGSTLLFKPTLPEGFDFYEVRYTYGKSLYTIKVVKGNTDSVVLDGIPMDKGLRLSLVDDHKPHAVEIMYQ